MASPCVGHILRVTYTLRPDCPSINSLATDDIDLQPHQPQSQGVRVPTLTASDPHLTTSHLHHVFTLARADRSDCLRCGRNEEHRRRFGQVYEGSAPPKARGNGERRCTAERRRLVRLVRSASLIRTMTSRVMVRVSKQQLVKLASLTRAMTITSAVPLPPSATTF